MNATRTIPEIRRVNELTSADRDRMFQLMERSFLGVRCEIFERDLSEKEWLIALRDAAGRIDGFTTMGVLRTELDGQPIAAVYSGDTVMSAEQLAQPAWMRTWYQHSLDVAESLALPCVWWLLLTCTHRSYRFLSAFARQYWPRPETDWPAEVRRQRDALVRLKFTNEFDATTGLVRSPEAGRPQHSSAKPDAVHLADPAVAYFVSVNPGYTQGDFLVCMTELSRANSTPLGLRLIHSIDQPIVPEAQSLTSVKGSQP